MICKKCNKEFETIYRNECKICGYWNRHKNLKNKIISENFWSKKELDIILECLLYNKINYINEILPLLNNKTLIDLASLLSNEMKVRGTTKQKVLLTCFVCNTSIEKTLEFVFKDRVYCSIKCRDTYRSKYFVGENSPSYKKIKVKCTNCKKEFSVIPYDYNKINSYGDNHNFCCQQCYWDYRKKYYVEEKNWNYQRIVTEEERKRMSENTIKMICDGKIPQTKTKPHIKINELLEKINVQYQNEYNCKYHSLDIFLKDYNLGIEIMGDYWNGSPLKYNYENLSKIQLKSIKQDKSKHTYIKKYHKFEILYLWETDINNNINLCEKLIKKYIETNGELQNYNSFNYYVNDNEELLLNENIVIPYFMIKNA